MAALWAIYFESWRYGGAIKCAANPSWTLKTPLANFRHRYAKIYLEALCRRIVANKGYFIFTRATPRDFSQERIPDNPKSERVRLINSSVCSFGKVISGAQIATARSAIGIIKNCEA